MPPPPAWAALGFGFVELGGVTGIRNRGMSHPGCFVPLLTKRS